MTELSDYKRLVERPMIAAKDAEIARLRLVIVEMADPSLSDAERQKIAGAALGWDGQRSD